MFQRVSKVLLSVIAFIIFTITPTAKADTVYAFDTASALVPNSQVQLQGLWSFSNNSALIQFSGNSYGWLISSSTFATDGGISSITLHTNAANAGSVFTFDVYEASLNHPETWYQVTLSTTPTTIYFTNYHPDVVYFSAAYNVGFSGVYVDSVTIAQGAAPISGVPEPSVYVMVLAGLTIVGAATWRRQRKDVPQSPAKPTFLPA